MVRKNNLLKKFGAVALLSAMILSTSLTTVGKSFSMDFSVLAVEEIMPDGITFTSGMNFGGVIDVGTENVIWATISPKKATNKSVTWTSSDSNIAVILDTWAVDSDDTDICSGVRIFGKNPGLATITAETSNGIKRAWTIEIRGDESEYCGPSVKYELASNGILTLQGEGETWDYINWSRFKNDKSIKEVIVEDGITAIGNEAFYGCTNIESVQLPNTLQKIGTSAFFNCEKLNLLKLPESLIRINATAFARTGIKHIEIPRNVEFIDQFAFSYTHLESISVEPGNEYFSSENGVLYNKDKTKIIKFPTLKDGSYVMPDLVTTDYDDMPIFYDCTRLTDVTLGEKYLKDTYPLGYGMGIEFIGCANLQNINCSPENQYYDAIDGVLFSKDKKTLLVFPSGRCGVYTVPDGTTNIGIGAFVNCINLSGIVIPDSVTKIANQSIGYSGNYGEKPKLMDNIDKFTIYGKPGSVVETYANENGIPFKDSSTAVLATEISLNYSALTENIGNTVTVTATVTPPNSIDQNVIWSSSNNNVATVSNGKVTAISSGKVTITAKTNNGKVAVCVVTVNDVLKNTSSVSKTKVNLGDVVNINGNATGGAGNYQYAVYYKKTSDTKWTTKQNFNTNAQIAVQPAKATTYDICVKVKDSSNAIVKKYFKVEVTQFTNVSTLSATSINFGNTVTVNAKATGGTGNYQYAVYYKKTSDAKWTTKQDFNTKSPFFNTFDNFDKTWRYRASVMFCKRKYRILSICCLL